MSTKHNSLQNLTWYLLGISLHVFLIFGGTYFLSPEFSLYPYFLSRGLIPYQQIIDQHFPMLFFGPLNLNLISLYQPHNLLFLYILILVFTDIFAILFLHKTSLKPHQKITAFFAFITLQIILGGQTLWIETFSLLFITIALFLGKFTNTKIKFLSGLAWGMTLAIRPNLVPLILIIWWLEGYSAATLIGIIAPPIWEFLWVIQNHLFESFKSLVIEFNAQVYTHQARFLPSIRDQIWTGLAFCIGLLTANTWAQIVLWVIVCLSVYSGVFPRFDLVRLLPFVGVWLWWISKFHKRFSLILIWTIILLAVIGIKRLPIKTNNFFYPPQLYQESLLIQQKFQGQSIYYLGGPDQLYVLNHTTPPGNYYLPSLPWYLSQSQYMDREIEILKTNKEALVSVNQDSRVDNKNLLDYSQPLQKLIQSEYMPIDQIGPLIIYHHI